MYELQDCIPGQTIDMMMINGMIEIESAPCLLDRPMKVSAKEQGSSLEVPPMWVQRWSGDRTFLAQEYLKACSFCENNPVEHALSVCDVRLWSYDWCKILDSCQHERSRSSKENRLRLGRTDSRTKSRTRRNTMSRISLATSGFIAFTYREVSSLPGFADNERNTGRLIGTWERWDEMPRIQCQSQVLNLDDGRFQSSRLLAGTVREAILVLADIRVRLRRR